VCLRGRDGDELVGAVVVRRQPSAVHAAGVEPDRPGRRERLREDGVAEKDPRQLAASLEPVGPLVAAVGQRPKFEQVGGVVVGEWLPVIDPAVDHERVVPRDREGQRFEVVEVGVVERLGAFRPVEEALFVVPPDRDRVVPVPNQLEDAPTVRPLPDEVADEHEEVVPPRRESVDELVESRATPVDVTDHVDVVARVRVDPSVLSFDPRSEPRPTVRHRTPRAPVD